MVDNYVMCLNIFAAKDFFSVEKSISNTENQIRELQRLKNSFNEQLNKNANLCDDTNQLENELQSVRQLFKTLGQNRT